MPPVLKHRNTTLSIDHGHLLDGVASETFLTADAAAASGTITVKNITGFAIDQILLLEDLGHENAEIVLTHASSAPSGTTVTLAANTVRAHTVGCKVRVLLYNRFELSHATTAAGSKTELTVSGGNPISGLGSGLIAIDPSRKVQTYQTTEHTSGFYFARYNDSVDTVFSDYSDALAFGGWDSNTVGYMIDRALAELRLTLSEKITRQDCYEWINRCLRLVQGKQVRWPEHFVHNSVISQASRGTRVITMPSDAYDTETNRSITAVRIGTGQNLSYLDPDEFDEALGNEASTQVTTQASAAATTLEIDNSYDFEDSGTVHVFVSGTRYAITYTGVTRSATAGVLTGVPASGDGSITVTIPVDTYVWQNEIEGQPTHFTVRNGSLEFLPLVDAQNDNANVTMDYAKVATEVNSDGDTIDLHRFDMAQSYLKWRMKMKARNDGTLDLQDGFYIEYKESLNDAIRTSRSGQVFPMRPKLNTVTTLGRLRSYIGPGDRNGTN